MATINIDLDSNASPGLRDDGEACLRRAFTSLEGLSCGDAFGECFFAPQHRTHAARTEHRLPPGPWTFTDDTMMAVSVCACLARHGGMEPEWLAGSLARHYDPLRGYGAAMHGLLTRIHALGETNWFEEAQDLFGGQGSFGNGAAMRVAPVGAYFAHDPQLVVEHAVLSAIATHCHPEAIAGAVAVALAAGVATRHAHANRDIRAADFLEEVRDRTPASAVRDGIDHALTLPASTETIDAALALGNGGQVTAQDTVPFTLWVAAHNLHDYEAALWCTIDGGGDLDTNCAIVGGIVAMRTGAEAIPEEWRKRREAYDALLATALNSEG